MVSLRWYISAGIYPLVYIRWYIPAGIHPAVYIRWYTSGGIHPVVYTRRYRMVVHIRWCMGKMDVCVRLKAQKEGCGIRFLKRQRVCDIR